MRSSRVLVPFCAAALLLGSVAAARPGGHGGFDPLARLDTAVAGLGLDSETREFAYGVIDEARQSQRALREVMRSELETMKALLEEPQPDEEAVLAQAEVLGDLHVESSKLELRALVRLLAALDDEDREALRSAMAPRRGGRRPGPDADAG